MCRKNHMQGCCLACLGIGILLGYWINTWLFCVAGSLGLLFLGFCRMRQR